MPPSIPFIACPVREDLPADVARLEATLLAGTRESQAKLAGQLITDAACDLIDAFFGSLLTTLAREHPGEPGYAEAGALLDDIKGKLRHYLGWVTGFFANERLTPVVGHYRGLMTRLPEDGRERSHIAFAITPALGADAQRTLEALRSGDVTDARASIEVLIRAIDEALEPLLLEPKRRMKFNFVVDKTLNGVLAVTMGVVHHKLRKLGETLPHELFRPVADHLTRFVHVT